MTNMFKLPNKYADVFVLAINLEDEEIRYVVRDKDTGFLVEPIRTTKFIVNEASGMVHFDARECPIKLFQHIYNTLE